MASLTRQIVDSFRRHFVTLSCVQQRQEVAQELIRVFSGFVVEIEREWFYVTAGHILEDIREALTQGSTFSIWRLGDHLANPRFEHKAVPYDFEADRWCVLHDANTGMDYAVTHLGWLYRRQLEVGGVVAIAQKGWSYPIAERDQWALVGVPSESIIYDGTTNINARLVTVKLLATAPPPMAREKADNQFYARLEDGSEQVVADVDGMSGGPIFGVGELDGQLRYGVIGVQSGWYRSARIIAFCPFATFGAALVPVVREALDKLASLGPPAKDTQAPFASPES